MTLAVPAELMSRFRSGAMERLERIDFGRVQRATTPAFDARLQPASDAAIKEFRIPIKYATIEMPKGRVFYFGRSEEVAKKYADVLQKLDPPFAKSKVVSGENGGRKLTAPLARKMSSQPSLSKSSQPTPNPV